MNDYNNFFDFHSPWYPPFRQAFESAEMPVTDVGRQMSRRSRTRTKNDLSRVDDINNMLRYLHSIFSFDWKQPFLVCSFETNYRPCHVNCLLHAKHID